MKINEFLKKRLKTLVLTELKKEETDKATIITSSPLDDQQLAVFYQVFPFLKNKQLEKIYDQNLIAGFILKWGSKMIDASLSGRIDTIVSKNIAS